MSELRIGSSRLSASSIVPGKTVSRLLPDGRVAIDQFNTMDRRIAYTVLSRAEFDALAIAKPTPAPAPSLSFMRVANGGSPVWPDPAITASRYGWIITNWWQAPQIEAAKKINPNLKALAYFNSSRLRDRDAAGNMSALPRQDYPSLCGQADSVWSGLYLGLLGSTFSDAWAATVKGLIAKYPVFDGVFMDDVNPGNDSLAQKTYSQSTWSSMLLLHVQRVRAQFPTNKLMIPNFNGCWGQYEAACRLFYPSVDGGFSEFLGGIWNADTIPTVFADGEAAAAAAMKAVGKVHLGNAPGGTGAALNFARKIGSSAFSANTDYNTETWSSAMAST